MIDSLKEAHYDKYLRVFWAILGVCILWQIATVLTRSVFLPGRIKKTLIHYKTGSETGEKDQSASNEKPDIPKDMFAPPQKMGELKCSAVLGDEAFINGQWYKVGSRVQEAEIIDINPASVKLLRQEKEIVLIPFDVPVAYADNNKTVNGKAPKKKRAPAPESTDPQPVRPGPGRFGGDRPRGGGPGGFMMGEERRQMYERYQNASPEEREAMRQSMRERFGGRGRSRDDRP